MMTPEPLHIEDIDLAMWDGRVPEDVPPWFKLGMLLGEETIDLTEEDEAILDAIWDQIAAEDRQTAEDARRWVQVGRPR